jgi:hypothetical protein
MSKVEIMIKDMVQDKQKVKDPVFFGHADRQ